MGRYEPGEAYRAEAVLTRGRSCAPWRSASTARAPASRARQKTPGVVATGTMPSGSNRVRSSGVAEISLISRLRRSTRRAGVPAGAKTPTHTSFEVTRHRAESGGDAGKRRDAAAVDVTASIRTFPLLTNGDSVLRSSRSSRRSVRPRDRSRRSRRPCRARASSASSRPALRSSVARWPIEPTPADPYVSVTGLRARGGETARRPT